MMKRNLITMMLILLLMHLLIPATLILAAENEFKGADPGPFGKDTSVEEVTVINGPVTENDNINRSKDSAFVPPNFGSPSSNTPGTGELLTPNISGVSSNAAGFSTGSYTASGGSYGVSASSGIALPGDSYYLPSDGTGLSLPPSNLTTAMYPSPVAANSSSSTGFTSVTADTYYSDGSIGTLSIPALGLTVKVYEEESLENMKRGAGHFTNTSCWDGNVAVAGHNRGVSNHFGQIHTLSMGDTIKYTTVYGSRTYEVYSITKISETDTSCLQRTNENIITLVTCVEGVSEQRWCVQARER